MNELFGVWQRFIQWFVQDIVCLVKNDFVVIFKRQRLYIFYSYVSWCSFGSLRIFSLLCYSYRYGRCIGKVGNSESFSILVSIGYIVECIFFGNSGIGQ